MPKTALHHGEFKIFLRPDGTMVVPDLAEHLIPTLRAAGASEETWQPQPCSVLLPQLCATRLIDTGLTLEDLHTIEVSSLRNLHDSLMARHRGAMKVRTTRSDAGLKNASLLDLKIELAHRLLSACRLCVRQCGAKRLNDEVGFCGLGAELQISAYAMLYNEGPYIGAPTFSIFLRGCCLRCSYCYRKEELHPDGRRENSPEEMAALLDEAAVEGAISWHFLGGNPDQSLPGILKALSLTKSNLPVAWNSNLLLTSEALNILKGVVDIWIPDFKFGNDDCAYSSAKMRDYLTPMIANLCALEQEPFMVVRCPSTPSHRHCCSEPIRDIIRNRFPHFLTVERTLLP